MAQAFYDLSIIKPVPGAWPYFAKGSKLENQDRFLEAGQTFIDGDRGFKFRFSPDADNHCYFALGVSLLDCEILVKARKTHEPTTLYANTGLAVCFRMTGGGDPGEGRPNNCYYIASGTSSTSDHDLSLYSIVAGNQTGIETLSSAMPTGDYLDRDVYYRIRLEGSNIKARAWPAEDSEPESWAIDVADGNHLSAGDVGLIFHQYELGGVYYFIGIGTGGDPAPDSFPGGNRVVRGSVHLPDNQDATGYTVRCYHRASGCFLDETVSDENGQFEFSLPIPEGEPVYCMAIDDLGDSWNAPIADLVLPIAPD